MNIKYFEAMAERGATEGEREAARKAVARLKAKQQKQSKSPKAVVLKTGLYEYLLVTTKGERIEVRRAGDISRRYWKATKNGELLATSLTPQGILKNLGYQLLNIHQIFDLIF